MVTFFFFSALPTMKSIQKDDFREKSDREMCPKFLISWGLII